MDLLYLYKDFRALDNFESVLIYFCWTYMDVDYFSNLVIKFYRVGSFPDVPKWSFKIFRKFLDCGDEEFEKLFKFHLLIKGWVEFSTLNGRMVSGCFYDALLISGYED